ncbi:hypothetical protein OHV08_23235 [Streptomyces canus]
MNFSMNFSVNFSVNFSMNFSVVFRRPCRPGTSPELIAGPAMAQ